jgi:hypothetical protein
VRARPGAYRFRRSNDLSPTHLRGAIVARALTGNPDWHRCRVAKIALDLGAAFQRAQAHPQSATGQQQRRTRHRQLQSRCRLQRRRRDHHSVSDQVGAVVATRRGAATNRHPCNNPQANALPRSAAFSASSRLRDLNDEVKTARMNPSSALHGARLSDSPGHQHGSYFRYTQRGRAGAGARVF